MRRKILILFSLLSFSPFDLGWSQCIPSINPFATGQHSLQCAPSSGSVQRYTVTSIANGTNSCASSLVSAVVFTGSGLNDATAGGTYTATSSQSTYTVIIDGTGTPDTFKWKKNAGSFTTLVAASAGAHTLSDGVTITFAATTGHTLNDQWVITAGLGCWQVNGVLGAVKSAGLTQSLTLFSLPANGYISAFRIKSAAACTGTATLRTGLGTATSSDFYMVSASTGYDLKAAVSATNFSTALPLVVGSTTTAAVNVVSSLTSTTNNLTLVADGCSFDVWAFVSLLP